MTSHADRTVLSATIVAGAMIAQQIGGKAARDAFFLTHFDVSSLPTMMVVAALVSIGVVYGMMGSRPAWLMPRAFAASGLIMLAEWYLAGSQPRVIAVALYLHISVFGSILISGFWSLVTECLDPHTARKRLSHIGTGAVVGALIGGILAERVGAYFSLTAIFPVLAALHLACAVLILLLKPSAEEREADGGDENQGVRSGLAVFKRLPYLRNLAFLVFLGAMSAALIDYAFKAQVADSILGGEAMMRFFALYYTGIGISTLLVQSTLSKRSLKRLGLGTTVASLPASVIVGSLGMLAVPGLASAVAARGGEATFRSSLFRSAYELFYSPVSRRDKRATKTTIDVLSERLGDAFGGVAAKLLLLLAPLAARSLIVGLAACLGALGVWICRRLNQGYIEALEANLLSREVRKGQDQDESAGIHDTFMVQREELQLQSVLFSVEGGLGPISEVAPKTENVTVERDSAGSIHSSEATTREGLIDPLVLRLMELCSRNPTKVRQALGGAPLEPMLIPQAILLLGSDKVARQAAQALAPLAEKISGQLGDALLDTELNFAIRRRIPGVLAAASSGRAVPPLVNGLDDLRFGVRFRCARALARLHQRGVASTLTEDHIFGFVLREVKVDPRIWHGRLVSEETAERDPSSFESVSRRRAYRRLEYIFTLLSLRLPRQPLKIAFRGLRSEDQHLKGTALEYLESVLPAEIRKYIWPYLTQAPQAAGKARAQEEIVSDLLHSIASTDSNVGNSK
ncbi:MAG: hypothetical protein V3S30_02265 [Thermoanaerobaculia bacterium]